MNIQQAKTIPLADYLAALGYQPAVRRSSELWYLSPLRSEHSPSFKVNLALNAWYDFGLGKGGDILDFVKSRDGLTDIPSALKQVESLMRGNIPPVVYQQPKEAKPKSTPMVLDSVGPITSSVLNYYLRSRGISPTVAHGRVFEAHYRCDGHPYYALAFPSRSQGFELRNPYFKGAIGTKDISIMQADPAKVAVFEGFFDYLTYLMQPNHATDATIIVLNSVSLAGRAVAAIRELGSNQIDIFPDNDEAGRTLLATISHELPEISISDHSRFYSDHADFNSWWSTRQHTREAERS